MNPSSNSYIIVVGVDHSEASRLALHEALEIAARRLPSEVHVLNVQTANSHRSRDRVVLEEGVPGTPSSN